MTDPHGSTGFRRESGEPRSPGVQSRARGTGGVNDVNNELAVGTANY
jgi:hypothetical protein